MMNYKSGSYTVANSNTNSNILLLLVIIVISFNNFMNEVTYIPNYQLMSLIITSVTIVLTVT